MGAEEFNDDVNTSQAKKPNKTGLFCILAVCTNADVVNISTIESQHNAACSPRPIVSDDVDTPLTAS